MKTKAIKLASLITALLVAVALTVGYVFAWILDRKDADLSLIGSSAGAYFDGTSGDGTAVGKEFIISNSTHMRNLAVLQNTGKFASDGVQQKYYFKIKDSVNSIDMGGIYIPPIGNDEYPFIGDFNGNGKTLANLKVTTNKTLLGSEYPTQSSADYEFSQAVGLFGMTGNKGKVTPDTEGVTDEDLCNIHNLIMENPTVDVSNTNTLYSTAENAVVGIAVGHIAGKCSSIGVKSDTGDGATLNVQVSGYSTFNSILGNLGEGVESSVTGGGHVAGSTDNVGYGGSLNFLEMMHRMKLMNDNSWVTPALSFNGLDKDSSSQLSKYQYMSLVVDNAVELDNDTYYNSYNSEIVPKTNIGFYIGAEAKIKPQLKSRFNTGRVYTAALDEYSNVVRKDVTDDLDSDIRGALDEMLNETWLYGVRFNNQIDINSGIEIQNANVAGYENLNITVPSNTVWFAAQETGMAKFIFSSESGKLDRGITVYQLTRSGASADNPYFTPLTNRKTQESGKDIYQGQGSALAFGGLSNVSVSCIESAYKNKQSNGEFTYSYGSADVNAESSELVYSYGWYTNNVLSDAYGLYYTEFPLIKGNEYALGLRDVNAAWIMYMDIGQNAAEDTSAIAPEKEVSAVDFIYDGVRIAQGGDTLDTGLLTGDFIVKPSGETWSKYESSKTSVYFENMNTLCKLVFIRLYSGSTSHTDKTKTICLEQSTPVPDTASEIKATYANYVCPTISGGSGTVLGTLSGN